MLDVDVVGLLDCAYNQNLLMDSRQLDDNTEGGLNNYGVRV